MTERTNTSKSSGQYATVPLSDLRIGARLRMPIYDPRSEHNILFLNAGAVITPTQVERLKKRGISRVRVHRSELNHLAGGDGPDGATANRGLIISRDEIDTSFARKIKKHHSSYDVQAIETITQNYQKSIGETRALFENLKTGDDVDGQAMVGSVNQSLLEMTDDFDLFLSLGISSATGEYPHGHSLKSSRLATAIGATMGLSEDELMELGLGCLLHDVGMLRIDRRLYESKRKLSPIELLEITKHPSYTFDMIEHIAELPVGSRMVAYQMHERWNGSGYPRHRAGRQIQPLATIAAVADVLVAMISDRPHRPGMLPYFAIQELIFETNRGLFDPNVVQKLLQTMSLFPIGSYVAMSDGRVGKVIRANREMYWQPIVELWEADTGEAEFEVLDLSHADLESELHITQAIARPETQPSQTADAKGRLRQLSFYGVGSYVELSDGRCAKVIRVNRRLPTEPIVQLWSRNDREGGATIDLSREADEVYIKRAISEAQLSDPGSDTVEGPLRQLSLFQDP